jgi:hypothetical protein
MEFHYNSARVHRVECEQRGGAFKVGFNGLFTALTVHRTPAGNVFVIVGRIFGEGEPKAKLAEDCADPLTAEVVSSTTTATRISGLQHRGRLVVGTPTILDCGRRSGSVLSP